MHSLHPLLAVAAGVLAQNCSRAPGGIRLSTDDGPPAREFIDEDNDDDDDTSYDDEPLPTAPSAPFGRQIPPALDGHARAEDVPLQNPLPVPPKP
ncbi:uncharacterized protein PHACADRAFT_260708 [Phanerochaete carnosa HHB-10118-sp]|uniref:Uncharacterized protein n=1 Tax=Phanerochaete carnosa (strain HHB-10118-sp) TaxID=650164 RepID=K5W0I8_PHACS|nr:uncharacterized protein PHACADRAFT_260708 [Phanerochaete carnosa HHB-10118-sp]EKM52379.1 hypothetical protein PHACADRAFT_260708 [Phanerochaete carnosa HHB-10118-sp]